MDVVDALTGGVALISGFATAEMVRRGTKRTVGPSSVAIGDGLVYVGNRGDSSVCAIDAVHLTIETCVTLDSPPDGLAYAASTGEVWATTPRNRSITVVDAADGGLKWKATIPLDGQPEGFAVDDRRGCFYTNLEDQDRTLRIDVRRRQVTSTWPAACSGRDRGGLALDGERNFLLVPSGMIELERFADCGSGGTCVVRSLVIPPRGVRALPGVRSRSCGLDGPSHQHSLVGHS